MFKLTPLAAYFPFLNKYGLTIGIVILTAAMMVPLADGSLKVADILRSFTTWQSIVAIVVGILVSWLGTRGISLIGAHPTIVNGLIIGTLLGVAFFKGVPVGPLIAAGILSLLIGKN
ncbi:putative membrane protein [Gilliamella apicola]|nr:putative membrane protein [Gilliamella apicola]